MKLFLLTCKANSKLLTMRRITLFFLLSVWIVPLTGFCQEYIAVIQSPVVKLMDVNTGDIVNPSFIDLTPLDPGTPKALIQVGEEIWISDQIRDRIDRFDLDGIHLGAITGGMDNIKGMELVNGSEVWLTNANTQNGAPGNAIIRFDLDGTNLGHFVTGESSFDIVDTGEGEVYISYINSQSYIERRDYDGNLLGQVVPGGFFSFVQQIWIDGDTLLAAVFSNNTGSGNPQGLYRVNISDGSIIDFWAQSGPRGIMATDNGSIVWTNSSGIHRLDPNTGTSSLLASGSAQFFGRLNLDICEELPEAPMGDVSQEFCQGALVSDIEANGTQIKWYSQPVGGTPLNSSTPLSSGTYYGSQTVDGCESEDRLAVTVTIISPETPTGDSNQSFEEGATLDDIVITPADVTWFGSEADALAGENPLDSNTLLEDGATYWAVNIEEDCLSEPFPVTITILLDITDFENLVIRYYPNPTLGNLHIEVGNDLIQQVVVYNLLGESLIDIYSPSNPIVLDLSSLPAALYLVQIHTDQNSSTFPIIKK